MKQVGRLALAASALSFVACTKTSHINAVVFRQQQSLAAVCKSSAASQAHRAVIAHAGNGLKLIYVDSDPCGLKAAKRAFGLVGKATGPGPLIIFAPQYGNSQHDQLFANSQQVLDQLQSGGYTVLDASNLSGQDLQDAVSNFRAENPDATSAIVVTAGHGANEPVQTDDGGSVLQHTVTATDVNDQGQENSTTLLTNQDILQPALSGLGMPPSQVLSVVSSCYAGQAANDLHATNPDAPVVAATNTNQLSWSTGQTDAAGNLSTTENMLTAFAQASDPSSPLFQAADNNHDGNLTTGEFANHLNTNQGGLGALQVYDVTYKGPDGQPSQNFAYQEPVVNTQTVTGYGNTTMFTSAQGSGNPQPIQNSPLSTVNDAKAQANQVVADDQANGVPYTPPTVDTHSGTMVGQPVAIGNVAGSTSEPSGDASGAMPNGPDAFANAPASGGDDSAAANDSAPTSPSDGSDATFADDGSGDWGVNDTGEAAATDDTVAEAPADTASSDDETDDASLMLTTPTKGKTVVKHHPSAMGANQMLAFYRP